MAEQPEEMLPKQAVPAQLRLQERQPECALKLQQHRSQDQRRKAGQDHQRGDQRIPGEIGILSSAMPGARYFRTDTVISTAAAMAEISTKVMPISQKSVLMPGEWIAPDRGGR